MKPSSEFRYRATGISDVPGGWMQMLGDDKRLLANRFERLVREHRDLDVEVKAITSNSYLNTAQQMQLNQLKKLKLSKKDQIEILRTSIG
jgi:uncharacterized protein YdcH (DUF465 family)